MYPVKLELFEGPLELLLQLLQKRELDITVVSLAVVTDQYLEHLRSLGPLDLEAWTEFIAIGAQLLVMKSLALLPREEELPQEEEAAEALVQRLKEYQLFKAAAAQLQEWEEQGQRSFPRLAPPPRVSIRPMQDLDLHDLVAAWQRVVAARPATPPEVVIAARTYTIEEKIQALRCLVAGGEEVPFGCLVTACRLEMVITFLALLELVRRGELVVRQERLFGEIFLSAAPSQE